ncbi:MAG: MBL fold metallo-hydrolase [Desulfobacteraceae bacterium 4572_130]|nr:MAG: MBL fold metallo-hydrolase [Desulfobacteraceae bacterium 4572_130]
MIIKKLEVGPIMANCYIIGCDKTKEAVVIDPGDEADKILIELSKLSLIVKYIINTHGHFDHVGANKRLKEVTKAKLLIHPEDEHMLSQLSKSAANWGLSAENSPLPDQKIIHGDEIVFGEITLKVIYTPGHSLGGVCLYTDGVVFSGDTLFANSIGRTDFPTGDHDTLIASIKEKLFLLDDDTIVYTGHGPETSIGHERKTNPFLMGS